jgi:Uma2 family endonuclease
MKTVVLGDPPEVLVSLIEQRKRLGLDMHDEVWEGDCHMAPAASFEHGRVGSALDRFIGPRAESVGMLVSLPFNLGESSNFRVPDLGVHRGEPNGIWIATAAIVVEIRSPDDETFDKFDFYFSRGVEEILVADVGSKSVSWFVRSTSEFAQHVRSELLGITSTEISVALGWSL